MLTILLVSIGNFAYKDSNLWRCFQLHDFQLLDDHACPSYTLGSSYYLVVLFSYLPYYELYFCSRLLLLLPRNAPKNARGN